MVEIWYGILAFTMIVYVTLDGRNFGAGILHLIVTRTPAERRQMIAAIGPLWSWHEVWLVAFGGVMFVAFPRLLGSAFSGYYLALFLVLWSLILRGISLEVGGHINDQIGSPSGILYFLCPMCCWEFSLALRWATWSAVFRSKRTASSIWPSLQILECVGMSVCSTGIRFRWGSSAWSW